MDSQIQELRRQVASGDPEARLALRRALARVGLRSLIGMSLSFAVKDILAGRVRMDEVELILASTTGIVEKGKPGPNFTKILVSGYLDIYWRDYTREQAETVLESLFPIIRELPHGLPDTWVDATKPHHWGRVPQGNGWGMVGTYISMRDSGDVISYTPKSLDVFQILRNTERLHLLEMADAYDYPDFEVYANEREMKHKRTLQEIRASLVNEAI